MKILKKLYFYLIDRPLLLTAITCIVAILMMILPPIACAEIPPYHRYEWQHWTDDDNDCQNTRQEVLIEESFIPVTFDEDSCRVVSGLWVCRFTGRVITNPRQLQIDHMVPLKEAHVSGGWKWDQERKREYANDLDYDGHLIAVYGKANSRKGSKRPDEWRPENKKYWCQYAIDWLNIKIFWGLDLNPQEAAALYEMLETCDD